MFLQPPLVVANPQRKKIPFWLPNVPLDVGNLQGFLVPDLSRHVDHQQILDFLEVTQDELVSFASDPICMAIPAVLAELVKRGEWRSLMLQGRWREKLQRSNVFQNFFAGLAFGIAKFWEDEGSCQRRHFQVAAYSRVCKHSGHRASATLS